MGKTGRSRTSLMLPPPIPRSHQRPFIREGTPAPGEEGPTSQSVHGSSEAKAKEQAIFMPSIQNLHPEVREAITGWDHNPFALSEDEWLEAHEYASEVFDNRNNASRTAFMFLAKKYFDLHHLGEVPVDLWWRIPSDLRKAWYMCSKPFKYLRYLKRWRKSRTKLIAKEKRKKAKNAASSHFKGVELEPMQDEQL